VPGPWVTLEALSTALAADLHTPAAELPASWANVLPRALDRGYYQVRDALLARGYTAAQVDAWDRRAEFNLEQSLFWALTFGANLIDGFDPRAIEPRDGTKLLATLTVTANGVPLFPAAGENGAGGLSVAGGRLDEGYYRVSTATEY
jgi:hypothetical protein